MLLAVRFARLAFRVGKLLCVVILTCNKFLKLRKRALMTRLLMVCCGVALFRCAATRVLLWWTGRLSAKSRIR